MSRSVCCFLTAGVLLIVCGCGVEPAANTDGSPATDGAPSNSAGDKMASENLQLRSAAFGAGCYWCSEAIFERIDGVKDVRTGFMGGKIDSPTREQIVSGEAGVIEVSVVQFNPAQVSYAQLLKVFWQIHDPTSWDRQGDDTGTLYRSAVFYYTPDQKAEAERQRAELDDSAAFEKPIVTQFLAAGKLYDAGESEQDYFRRNRDNAHCQQVIQPKIEAFEKKFTELIISN